jgi:hypothetical protein
MTFEGEQDYSLQQEDKEKDTQHLTFKEDENYKFYVRHQQMHIDKLFLSMCICWYNIKMK